MTFLGALWLVAFALMSAWMIVIVLVVFMAVVFSFEELKQKGSNV